MKVRQHSISNLTPNFPSRPSLAEVVAVAHDHGLSVLVDAAGELPPHANPREIVAAGADLVAFSGGKAIRGHLERVAAALEGIARTAFVDPADGESLPVLEITLDEAGLGRVALDVCRRLRHGSPPVYVGHGLLNEGKLVINPYAPQRGADRGHDSAARRRPASLRRSSLRGWGRRHEDCTGILLGDGRIAFRSKQDLGRHDRARGEGEKEREHKGDLCSRTAGLERTSSKRD